MTQQWFLYLMVFIAATTFIGYCVVGQYSYVILMMLVGIVVQSLSKNIAVSLLSAVLVVNLLAILRQRREGMENATDTTTSTSTTDPSSTTDSSSSSTTDPSSSSSSTDYSDPTTTATTSESASAPATPSLLAKAKVMGATRHEVVPKVTAVMMDKGKQKPYVDHATTLQEAYSTLQDMIGEGGLKQMTTDTKALMKQQQELFQSIQDMKPSLESAMGMLKGFDLKSLSGFMSKAASQ